MSILARPHRRCNTPMRCPYFCAAGICPRSYQNNFTDILLYII
ncbi:hypothetical protein DWUX_457 [Desulfovibrio diazotrophicus]|nr:hypothetical protein DWUX_457 [Desulfovibrio diazotrophicus]